MNKNKKWFDYDDEEEEEEEGFGSKIRQSFEKYFSDIKEEENFDYIFKKNKDKQKTAKNDFFSNFESSNDNNYDVLKENKLEENKIVKEQKLQEEDNYNNVYNEEYLSKIKNQEKQKISTSTNSTFDSFDDSTTSTNSNNFTFDSFNNNLHKDNDNYKETKEKTFNYNKTTKQSFSNVYSSKDKTEKIDKKLLLDIDSEKYLKDNNYSISKIRSIIEATLFVMGSDGLNLIEIQKLVDLPIKVLKNILEQMMHEKDVDINSGLCIKNYGSVYKLISKESTYFDVCKILNKKESKTLSKAKLEILSIIAYNQPCTKRKIEAIRAKDPTNQIYSLLELGLIEKHSNSKEPGRPKLYTVSQLFFDLFGIKSLSELPKIKPDSESIVQDIISSIEE